MASRVPIAVISLLCVLLSSSAEALPQKPDRVFDPFMRFVTEGTIGVNFCFRFGGALPSRQPVYGLKREETPEGPVFLLGQEKVTNFPEWIYLEVWLRQAPCPRKKGERMLPESPEVFAQLVKELRLELSWKSGLAMHPVEEMRFKGFELLPRLNGVSYPASRDFHGANWRGEISVRSTGVPLTDSLVIIVRTADGTIAARTAARF